MKKLLLTIVVSLTLVSCEEVRSKDVIDFSGYKASPTDSVTPYRPEYATYVDKFTFDGHRYLGFSQFGTTCSSDDICIVHDPDCPCKNKGEE